MTDTRPLPTKKNLRYAITGAGMSGILAGVRLREAGENNFTIYDKGGRLGGTWRENRYPGLTCDVPAHAYTYSFAPNSDWSACYAPGPEICEYFERVFHEHGLEDALQLNQEIRNCEFDETARKWRLTFADGSTDSADVVIAATGVLHHPKMPEIPGIDEFAGQSCHSARWDDDIVIDGKRVGIIGNGSTGVQIVGAIAGRTREFTHFQRSPQWIMPIEHFSYTDEQRAAFRDDPQKIEDIRMGEEYWSAVRRFNTAIINIDSADMQTIEVVARRNLEESISDPELRERLRPSYRAACKRLIYSTNYYQAAQRLGVIIERSPIERIEPTGIRMSDGTLHELDVIIYATGFRADRFMRPMKVFGREGADLDSFWETRATAYLAVTMPDFPNFFMLNGPTGPVGNFSLIDIAEQQWGYLTQLLDLLRSGEYSQICASGQAMADYETRRIEASRATIWATGCSSWYLDKEGVPGTWPWSYEKFEQAMAAPDLRDFDLR